MSTRGWPRLWTRCRASCASSSECWPRASSAWAPREAAGAMLPLRRRARPAGRRCRFPSRRRRAALRTPGATTSAPRRRAVSPAASTHALAVVARPKRDAIQIRLLTASSPRGAMLEPPAVQSLWLRRRLATRWRCAWRTGAPSLATAARPSASWQRSTKSPAPRCAAPARIACAPCASARAGG